MDEDCAALGCLTIIISIALLSFSIWEFVKIVHIERKLDQLSALSCEHLGDK